MSGSDFEGMVGLRPRMGPGAMVAMWLGILAFVCFGYVRLPVAGGTTPDCVGLANTDSVADGVGMLASPFVSSEALSGGSPAWCMPRESLPTGDQLRVFYARRRANLELADRETREIPWEGEQRPRDQVVSLELGMGEARFMSTALRQYAMWHDQELPDGPDRSKAELQDFVQSKHPNAESLDRMEKLRVQWGLLTESEAEWLATRIDSVAEIAAANAAAREGLEARRSTAYRINQGLAVLKWLLLLGGGVWTVYVLVAPASTTIRKASDSD